MPQRKSDGKVGEAAAEIWFKMHNWDMDRHQPPTRIIYGPDRKPHLIHSRSNGIFDYTGARNKFLYTACEVKECDSERMPASRLDTHQREWGDSKPPGTCYVGIYWVSGETFFEVFPYIPKGSYKKGTGMR